MPFFASASPDLVTFHMPTAHEWVAIVWTWLAMAIIIGMSLAAGFGSKGPKSKVASLLELIYAFVDDMAQGAMGRMGRAYVPFAMTAFLMVLTSNWLGLLPLGAFKGDPHAAGGVVITGLKPEVEAHPSAAETPAVAPTPGAEPGHEAAATAPAHEAEHEAGEHHGPLGLAEAPSANMNMPCSLAVSVFFAVWIYGYIAHYRASAHGHGDHGHGHDDHGHGGGNPITAFISWLGHYVQPTPMLWKTMDAPLKYVIVPPLCVLFVVLNAVEEVAHVISLTLRLFGNVGGEHQVKLGLFAMMFTSLAQALDFSSLMATAGSGMLFALLWGVSVFVSLIGTLGGFIQAMVFTMLTLSYISHAVSLEH